MKQVLVDQIVQVDIDEEKETVEDKLNDEQKEEETDEQDAEMETKVRFL